MNPEELNEELEAQDDDIIVHMNKKEIENLSSIQPSGIVRNNPWKIPEFHELWDMIQTKPEIEEKVRSGIQHYIYSDASEKDQEANLIDQMDKNHHQKLHNDLFGESRVAEAIGHQGTNGDSEIALMPKGMFHFLWDSVPPEYREKYQDVNEHTGFPEFGIWSTILGGIGGIVGSIFPVVGTTIGAGAGALLGGAVDHFTSPSPSGSENTSEDEYYNDDDDEDYYEQKSNFGNSVSNFGGALLDKFLGPKESGNGLKNAISSGASGAGSIFPKGVESTMLTNPLFNIGKELVGSSDNPIIGIGKTLLGSLFGSRPEEQLKRGNKTDRMNMRKYHSRLEKASKEKRAYNENIYKDFMDRFHPRRGNKPAVNLVSSTPLVERGFVQSPNQYKEGGEAIRHHKPIRKSIYLKGDESGQADNIYVKVPEHTFIIDAQTVSLIGDGNSENGGLRLDEMVDQIPSFKIPKQRDVDCALAAGEYAITPEKVAGYGNGDIRKGIEILKSFVKEIKKHKKLEVKTIPKPTKNLFAYIKKNAEIGLKK